jgi:hypothetical protein
MHPQEMIEGLNFIQLDIDAVSAMTAIKNIDDPDYSWD